MITKDSIQTAVDAVPADEWRALGIARPSTAVPTKHAVREIVRALITPHLAPMIEAQVAQAKGLKYLVARDENGRFQRIGPEGITGDPDQEIEVWEKDPSTAAFTDLMNRAIDKPKEQEQEIVVQHNADALLARLDAWKVAHRTTPAPEREALPAPAPEDEPVAG